MFKPFADDSSVSQFGYLSAENGDDRILIHGDVEITRDQQGLKLAQELLALLKATVQELQAEPNLPEKISHESNMTVGKNPFA